MTYGYIRVSTDHQTTENQKFEIQQFAIAENVIIDSWISETISSTYELKRRKLGKLIRKIQKDDLIIASELSRLGRNLLQIMSILHHCMSCGAQIWTIKDNYRLGTDISSKVLAFAFGLSAEIERNLISQRTKEALARIKADGQKLGRPYGSFSASKLHISERRIRIQINRGISHRQVAKDLNVHRKTLEKFIYEKGIIQECTKSKIQG
ncbi:MAG: master DNA invertase Mpi family serine-type recombinase [Rickettsiales bacterium]|jgi:DNA invertase Pin-like site-specific DNA recombinase|nr:master DNA invertase Mpi family serine-type recombinase [Rickettsiales bacterium]